MHNYSPTQSQYFAEPPFAAITAASILGYVSISWPLGFLPILQGKTAPAPSRLMGSTGVQQSLSHTTDSQLDLGLGFDSAIPRHLNVSP
jgi:hypothetical protein